MAMQRPGRPSTRLNQPAVNVPPSKPATRVVQKQQAPAPATGRARSSGSSTRSVAKQSSSRPVPKQAAKSNSTMMIAIGAGVVVVLGIAAFALSGGHEKHEPVAPKTSSKPKPVDVSSLENEGLSKCNEGLALIQKHQALLSSSSISDSQKSMLKADLEKSRKLIGDGMGLLTQANEKSKNTYDTKQYQEALITVRKKLMELRDEGGHHGAESAEAATRRRRAPGHRRASRPPGRARSGPRGRRQPSDLHAPSRRSRSRSCGRPSADPLLGRAEPGQRQGREVHAP